MDEDRIEGKVKEGAGKLTGDEELEKEGQAQDSWGKAKDKAEFDQFMAERRARTVSSSPTPQT